MGSASENFGSVVSAPVGVEQAEPVAQFGWSAPVNPLDALHLENHATRECHHNNWGQLHQLDHARLPVELVVISPTLHTLRPGEQQPVFA